MSEPVIQSQTADEKLREKLAADAFTADRMRRAGELARMEERGNVSGCVNEEKAV